MLREWMNVMLAVDRLPVGGGVAAGGGSSCGGHENFSESSDASVGEDRPARAGNEQGGRALRPEADAGAENQHLLAQAARRVGQDVTDLRLDQHGSLYHSRVPLPNAALGCNHLRSRGDFAEV